MFILYCLATLWAIGTFGLLAVMMWDTIHSIIGAAVYWCVCLPLWAVLGLAPFYLINHESGPELAVLLESEWVCTASHQTQVPITNMVGKVPVTTMSTHTVCDQYNRK